MSMMVGMKSVEVSYRGTKIRMWVSNGVREGYWAMNLRKIAPEEGPIPDDLVRAVQSLCLLDRYAYCELGRFGKGVMWPGLREASCLAALNAFKLVGYRTATER